MPITLPASVYTADHGYAWSAMPAGIDAETLDGLLADALATRPDFAEADAVSSGVVVRGGTAAAFTVRRAPTWDAVGRDADYAAFAFLPPARAADIDFGVLFSNDFFARPTHTPPAFLTYDGPASAEFPIDAPGRLLCHNRLEGFDAHATGALITRYCAKADRWTFLATGDQVHDAAELSAFTVTTSPWHR